MPKDFETRPTKCCGQSKNDSPPDLVSCSSADNDSATDSNTLGVVQESEREMWDNHPSVIATEQAKPGSEPVAPPILTVVEEDPSRASEEADGGIPARVEQPVEPKPCRKKEPEWVRDTDGRLKRRNFIFSKMTKQEF